jgi:hypothetical protein
MKKLILCFTLAAFASLPVFAGSTAKCDKSKTECKQQAKTQCSKSACCKGKQVASKGAEVLVR